MMSQQADSLAGFPSSAPSRLQSHSRPVDVSRDPMSLSLPLPLRSDCDERGGTNFSPSPSQSTRYEAFFAFNCIVASSAPALPLAFRGAASTRCKSLVVAVAVFDVAAGRGRWWTDATSFATLSLSPVPL